MSVWDQRDIFTHRPNAQQRRQQIRNMPMAYDKPDGLGLGWWLTGIGFAALLFWICVR